jgi:hypothetical protein
VQCFGCRHEVVINVDKYPGDLLLKEFAPRMVCTKCGMVGGDVRPNWKEQPPRASLTGAQWVSLSDGLACLTAPIVGPASTHRSAGTPG